jgi:hypothetical protein
MSDHQGQREDPGNFQKGVFTGFTQRMESKNENIGALMLNL